MSQENGVDPVAACNSATGHVSDVEMKESDLSTSAKPNSDDEKSSEKLLKTKNEDQNPETKIEEADGMDVDDVKSAENATDLQKSTETDSSTMPDTQPLKENAVAVEFGSDDTTEVADSASSVTDNTQEVEPEKASTVDTSAIESTDKDRDTTQELQADNTTESKEVEVKEKRGRGRPSNAEKRAAPAVIETRQKSKRPRRHITAAVTPNDPEKTTSPANTSATSSPAPRGRGRPKKVVETKDSSPATPVQSPYYVKGDVLAVRNEDGGFYLCMCPNNIFTIAKSFKVQWLDKASEKNVFQRSYFDYLHFNSVLYSGVLMKKTDNNQFLLPEDQEKKINHRLEKVLRGEEEISSDSDSDDSSNGEKKMTNLKKAAKKKRSQQDVISDDEMPVAALLDKTSTPKSHRRKSKDTDGTRKLGKIQIAGMHNTGVKRKSQKYEVGISSPSVRLGSAKSTPVKSGASGSTTGRPRGRPPKHLTPKSGSAGTEIMSSDSGGAVRYMINPEVVQQMKQKQHRSNENLVPNQAIDVATKDPSFDLRQSEPHLPKDKLAIRAVILQDVEELESIFGSASNMAELMCKTRTVDVQLTAMHYALRAGNAGVLKSLAFQLTKLADFSVTRESNTPIMLRDSSDTQNGFKGEELSAVDISKGMKEGNHAFLKDIKPVFACAQSFASDLAHFACSYGVSPDMLQLLIDVYPKSKDVNMKELLFENIYRALELGHVETAAFLMRASRQENPSNITSPAFGASSSPSSNPSSPAYTELHELVLHNEEPVPSAFTVKDAKKKSGDNYRIQPVHCAACNPDVICLKQLIAAAKECLNTMDARNRRPIHYAAACSSTQPLDFLISKVSIEEQDVNGMTPLMIAAEAGRDKNVEVLLRNASSSKVLHVVNVIDRPDRSNRAAVHYAAMNGHAKVIDVLAKFKADLNKPVSVSKARATPLMLAAANGHVQTCIALVECGASVEVCDKLQRTALIHAAMNGHYPVITYLLNKGADPNVADSSNNTAIHYAAAYGWYHCVLVLLQASANPDVYNDKKMPPIGVALLKNHRETAHLLAEHHADANFRDERGRTLVSRLLADEPLSWQLVDMVTYILEAYKPEVNAQDVLGMAAIHHLASNSLKSSKNKITDIDCKSVSLYLAEMLLDRGAELNMADYRGRLPLYFAIDDMNVSLIELFVRRESHCPRSTNSSADNVLHMLAKSWDQGNMADIVLGLVNTTAQIVQELAARRNKYGFTPLLLLTKSIADYVKPIGESSEATENENKKLQKKLEDFACPLLEALVLAAKSDVSAVNTKTRRNYRNAEDDGKSAAHYLSKAIVDKECNVLACLLRHKPKLDILDQQGASPLVTALLSRNCKAVQMLLDVGAQPNYCSGNKKHKYPAAPLILAVSRHGSGEDSLLPAIRALLRTISDIKLVPPDPRNGRTALMYAVEKEEELDLVNALLEKQASLSETDAKGHAPLHLAVNASGPSSALFDIPDLLIEKGASLTVADSFGRIPLHYAYTKMTKECASPDQVCDPIELTALLTSGMSGDEVDTADLCGRTPLHEAARRGAMICCMHLVERGANINRQDADGNTPLSLAVKAGHNSCAVMLIQKEANVNTNVITIPSTPDAPRDTDTTATAAATTTVTKWRLKSSIAPAPKSTCEPVFKVVVEKGWQGVTYVMLDRLEACGVKYAAAVESAMRARKYQVVLSLLRKQRDSGKLCEKNDLKQNLLHILAINRPDNTDVQVKVARVLIERGVPSYTTDDHSCTPLHYAAFTKNLTLIKFFIERNPSSFRGMIALTDMADRNAFSALLWNPVINDDVTVSILKLFLEHDRGSGAINRTCKFPIPDNEPTFSDPLPTSAVTDYFNEKVEFVIVNPLIRAIQLRAHRVIDLLLEYNIDINLQVDGLKNQTPLMLAVQQNDEYVVRKLLTHKTPVLLSALDSDDRTVLHHAAKPLTYGYWENMTILRLLLDHGVPVQQVDKFGRSALSYALEGGSGRMSDELQSAMNIPAADWEKPNRITASVSDGIDWTLPVPEYEVDAVTILDRIREDEMENESEQSSPNPDMLSGLRESGEIVFDPTVNRFCDVFLIAVDVQQSGNVQYNFFRMQVIHQKGKNLYMFFTRWGVIGEKGNWQTSPFNTPGNAIKEFAKYFKLKTANEWRSINNFKSQTRKFHLVSADVQRQRGVADLEFDLHTDINSLLTSAMQGLLADLINVESMKVAMRDSTNVDPDVIPFGRLEKDRLIVGIDILNDIQELINSSADLKTSDPQDQIRLQRTLEKIQQRSTEYYRVLPPRGGIFDRIRPICNTETLSRLILQTKRLQELEFANKVLLGAQYRINEMNPLDYVYRSIGCQMQVMTPDSDESQYLLQCLSNAGSEVKVHCIYRVSRPGEAANIVGTGLGNYRMLWYGTNILNLMTILHKGVQPTESPVGENLPQFGKGIYLSDMAARAMQDCKVWAGESKYMILCQVALGHVKEIREKKSSSDAEVANSVMTVGSYVPKPGKELILPEGGAISLGEKVGNPNCDGALTTYNEYVVYSPEQVCIRYMIRFETDDDAVLPRGATAATTDAKAPK